MQNSLGILLLLIGSCLCSCKDPELAAEMVAMDKEATEIEEKISLIDKKLAEKEKGEKADLPKVEPALNSLKEQEEKIATIEEEIGQKQALYDELAADFQAFKTSQ